MDLQSYHEFEQAQAAGLKKQAAAAVARFVQSFTNEQQKEQWVWQFLPQLEMNRHNCIRHELFIHLVYPCLRRGFDAGDYQATLWLGKLIQNLYQTQNLFAELGYLDDMRFYLKCYELNPEQQEGRVLLLGAMLRWLSHAGHEWPECILYGMGCADAEQCEEIATQAAFALSLAETAQQQDFIRDFLGKLQLYQQRLAES